MPEHLPRFYQEIGQDGVMRDFSILQTRNLHRKAIFSMTCINDKYEDLWKCLEPWNVTCINAPAVDMKITELLPIIISESQQWIDSMEKGEGFDTMPEHLPRFYQEIGQDGVMPVWNTGMTKKKKGKERTQQNLYRPKRHVPKKESVPRKPKPTQAQLNDPEFSDDDTKYSVGDDDEGRIIVLPKRSFVLSNLPDAMRDELRVSKIVSIPEDAAKICLGTERFALVNATKNLTLTLTDSNGRVHMFWIPSKLSSLSVFENNSMMAAGDIRDQLGHPLCWNFSFCDLLSSTCVLYGHMEKYMPLSQIFVCQNVDRKSYKKRVVTDPETKEERDHSCYEGSMYNALKYLKNSEGIPKAKNREIGEFDCNLGRSLQSGEKLYGKIRDVFRYKRLTDALKRLQTHPVTASLICFEGWENSGIYRGPYSGSQPPYYMGEHQVLMLDCIEHEGIVVIRCKSSNGKRIGNSGYIYVDPSVRFMEVGAARKKGVGFYGKKYPQNLLYDFYSLDMDKGIYPTKFKIEETESLKFWNKKFRVDFSRGRGQTSRMQGSSSTNLPPISPYSGESASQPAGNNPAEGQFRQRVLAIAACNGESASQPAGNIPAVDLINRNQVNNEEGQSRQRVLAIAVCNGESASQPAGNNPAVDLINRNQVNNEEGQSCQRVLVIAACNLPLEMSRGLVNRLCCAEKVKGHCSSALKELDGLPLPSTIQGSLKIKIESVLATSVTFIIDAEESFSWGDTNHYRMFHREATQRYYSKHLTRELFSTSRYPRVKDVELTPATEYCFKIVSFSGVKELSVDEFKVSTQTLQEDEDVKEVAAVLMNMPNCNNLSPPPPPSLETDRQENGNKMEKSESCRFGFEQCVKLIRQLECSGEVKNDFREKFLSWYSLRATAKEKHIVEIFVDTFKDDTVALAEQLIDTFSDCISRKRPAIGGGSSGGGDKSIGLICLMLQD